MIFDEQKSATYGAQLVRSEKASFARRRWKHIKLSRRTARGKDAMIQRHLFGEDNRFGFAGRILDHPLVVQPIHGGPIEPFHADRCGRAGNKAAQTALSTLSSSGCIGINSFSTAIPFLHYRHPMTACILYNSFL
jgi:hypothetical protein